MTSRSLLCSILIALCALAVPAGAAAEPVAAPGAATAVREYQGTIVFSRFDPAANAWRLAIRRAGAAAAELLPVAPGDQPFQADIGPDSGGRPQLIYQRCAETCDLFVYSLAAATGERPVRNANDPEHHDTAPTLWRGRIAWARIYGEGRDRKVVVYTKLLSAPRSRPSTRLPGVPLRRCPERGACSPTVGRSVDALELWGSNLAEVVGYACAACSGIAQTELRLVRVPDRTAAQIAFTTQGLSGQSLIGPSFVNGRLGWYKACLGDPAGCAAGQGGAFRYGLSTGTYGKGDGGPIRVDGYADSGRYLYEAVDCSVETQAEFNTRCRIERVDPPEFRQVRAPLRD